MTTFTITVDACDYTVEETHAGDVIRVFDSTGQKIADAERDHACEYVQFGYFTEEEGCIGEAGQEALFHMDNKKLAEWLVATHPCV